MLHCYLRSRCRYSAGVARRDPFGPKDLETQTPTEADSDDRPYQLPDGTHLSRHQGDVAEVLVSPWKTIPDPQALFGKFPIRGTAGLVADTLMSTNLNLRQDLSMNIVLTGGASHAEKYHELLKDRLENFNEAPRRFKVRAFTCSAGVWSIGCYSACLVGCHSVLGQLAVLVCLLSGLL